MLAGDGGLFLFEVDGYPRWCPVEDRALFARLVELGWDREVRLGVVPRSRRDAAFAGHSSVFWVRTEGRRQARALASVRPRPTMVVREGSSSRCVALWALSRALTESWVVRGNERLSARLRSRRGAGQVDFSFAPPGVVLRAGRCRPCPVVVAELDPEALYSPREVVGHLRDAPDPDAWRRQWAVA